MADELIAILSETGTPTGEILLKSEAHRLGLYHASVHIWIYTPDGEVLVQQRAADKDTFPNLWDISVAGHIAADETPIDAALREIEEEIGWTITPNQLLLIARNLSKKVPKPDFYDHEFHYIYVAKLTAPIDTLIVQEEEVAAIKLIPTAQLIADIQDPATSKYYVPHGSEYYTMVYEGILDQLK